jgi:hypothetical protein
VEFNSIPLVIQPLTTLIVQASSLDTIGYIRGTWQEG